VCCCTGEVFQCVCVCVRERDCSKYGPLWVVEVGH